MTPDVIIGVDAGTSMIKAVAFDLSGAQIGAAGRPNSYKTLPSGGVEQDMRRTWADAAAVIAQLLKQTDGLANRVLALSVTGQGDGCWLIDAEGEPVHDGWLWLDGRAAQEAREIAQSEHIDLIYRTTGTGVNVCQMRTHLRWMARHAPELLERAATALHPKDYLYYRLTGERATDPTEGVFTFGDFRSRGYSEEVIAALGLSTQRRLLPPIVDGAQLSHKLTRDAAAACGLAEGVPVCLGYVDIMCSALGAGLYDAKAAPGLAIVGSTGVQMRFAPDADAIVLNDDRSGYVMAFPGRAYAQIQTNMAATLNIDWMLDLGVELLRSQGVTRERDALLEGLDERVMSARLGAALYHPYISAAGERGPFTNPSARASFFGLDQSVGWFDMMRGVYDGLALAARDCYAAMGGAPSEIRLTGGAAQSAALRRIFAATLDRPVRIAPQAEAGAAGAAMIAAIQQGVFADADAAASAWVTPHLLPPEAPDQSLAATYDALFDSYLSVRKAAAPAWEALSTMRGRLK